MPIVHARLGARVARRAFLRLGAAALPIVSAGGAVPRRARAAQGLPPALQAVRALTFDVFGTVVDWRSSIIREGRALGVRKGLDVDWAELADQWRAGYGPAMARVRRGELPWTKIDALHRMILDSLVPRFGLSTLTAAELEELNQVWHRLRPWPDAIPGLTRLRARYVLATLSNGNVALLVNMAKHAGLPWDAVLSAELARAYKPDAQVYLSAADLLGLDPAQIMMVAAHPGDLRASAEIGFRTAFVPRPLEHGPGREREAPISPGFDLVASDFEDLARQLGL